MSSPNKYPVYTDDTNELHLELEKQSRSLTMDNKFIFIMNNDNEAMVNKLCVLCHDKKITY